MLKTTEMTRGMSGSLVVKLSLH